MTIPAFPKILHIGATGTENIWLNEVEVTEKLDGSQFSVGRLDNQLHMRSKGAVIYPESPPQMFDGAVKWALDAGSLIPEGYIIHGEWFMRPKHNCLAYNSVPKNGFAMFGVRHNIDKFLDYHNMKALADDLSCDIVPLIAYGKFTHQEIIEKTEEWLNSESVLGGPKMEGIVVKNYSQTGLLGGMILPILCAKYVSEHFKETNKTNWKASNPGHMDKIGEMVRAEARWQKAIQYLRDCGKLEGTPRDIGSLFKQIHEDIELEEKELIKSKLWDCFRKDILRIATRGFAEYYKEQLLKGEIESSSEGIEEVAAQENPQ